MRARPSDGSGSDPRRRCTAAGYGGGHHVGVGDAVDSDARTAHNIGVHNESSLHRQLKELLAAPGDRFEQRVDRFTVDLLRGDTCIEIQTGRFGAMGAKLDRLLPDFHVHVVHPISVGTWLDRPDHPVRKSPKKGRLHDVFAELVSVPTMLDHPNLTVEVFLVDVDVVKIHDPSLRRRRGGWRTVDTRLRAVHLRHGLRTTADLAAMLPDGLPPEWTTKDLATHAKIPRRTAQQMAYVLRANDLVVEVARDRAGARFVTPA